MDVLFGKFIDVIRALNPHLTDDEIDVLFKGKKKKEIIKHLYSIDVVPYIGIIVTKKSGDIDEIRKQWKDKKAEKKYGSVTGKSPYFDYIKEHYDEYRHLSYKERLPAIARAWSEYKRSSLHTTN